MSFELILPALIAIACGVAAGWFRLPLRPMVAVRVLTAIAVVVAATTAVVLAVVVVGFAARSALVLSLIQWCPVVPLHHHVGYAEGTAAVVLLGLGAWRARRVLIRRRWAAEGTQGQSLSVLDCAEPIAYAAPGDPGCVVISRGLLDALAPRERQVVVAHERAHLHHRHHRYLLAGELAVAIVPMLLPLVAQLRLATERSADETAVHVLDGDRQLVAHTIAHAALTRTMHSGLVGGFGGASVPARVAALIGPPDSVTTMALGGSAGALVAVSAVVAGSVQIHHLAGLVDHLCHL
mgnify:CR=1 FL=1